MGLLPLQVRRIEAGDGFDGIDGGGSRWVPLTGAADERVPESVRTESQLSGTRGHSVASGAPSRAECSQSVLEVSLEVIWEVRVRRARVGQIDQCRRRPCTCSRSSSRPATSS